MARICLTGKGNENGRLVTRDEWRRRIEAAGHFYTDNADHADVLVASRTNTIKAINAAARGVEVKTYSWLSGILDDKLLEELQAPVGPTPINTAELEENPLWGSF